MTASLGRDVTGKRTGVRDYGYCAERQQRDYAREGSEATTVIAEEMEDQWVFEPGGQLHGHHCRHSMP